MSRSLWCLSIAFALSLPAGAQEISGQTKITPAHVYQQVALVRAEIELIRMEMGKPAVETPPIQVEDAAPREVYFQAATLFRKADRLAFEHTRERVDEPPMPAGQLRPAEVHIMVVAALERVRNVKEALAITEQSESAPLNPGNKPTEVFNAIVTANRELNNLLDQRFAPGDVYQQVSVAIAYMSRLLDSPGEVSTPPEPPPFERRKRPADVYRRLIDCFDEIHRIGEKSGVPMLNLKFDEQQIELVEPSDVYDLVSILVSELSHLHRQLPDAAPPRKAHNPGSKLPSHVYQRIGILHGQIDSLLQKAETNPDWLKD